MGPLLVLSQFHLALLLSEANVSGRFAGAGIFTAFGFSLGIRVTSNVQQQASAHVIAAFRHLHREIGPADERLDQESRRRSSQGGDLSLSLVSHKYLLSVCVCVDI